jgi:hypothetical protein
LFGREDWTQATGSSQGWQAIEDELRLSGWSKTRRVYNWWSWYVRAANRPARREALTSRALLLAAVGRAIHHARQTTLHLTPMHAKVGLIKSMIANVQAAIGHVKAIAQQLPGIDRWAELLRYICQRIVGQNSLPIPPPAFAAGGNCDF